MARRSRDEILAEFHRLYDCFDAFLNAEEPELPADFAAQRRALIRSRATMLSWLESGEKPSGIEQGIRQALNDQREDLRQDMVDDPVRATRILARYRQATGREFFADAGHPKREARAILRRRQIASETEWHVVNAILADNEQTVFSQDETHAAANLCAQFERQSDGKEGLP